jgi:translation initiation factor 5B
MQNILKSPIITVAGHVDHGKTTLLDYLRSSAIAEKEAGRITQKISFSFLPGEYIKKICPLIEAKNIQLEIPGFLFIDTPGHAAFSNLRKRGGALADLSILVIDINEGIKPQTAEVIQMLKISKVPFIIALNKIDNISGWKQNNKDIVKSINSQATHVRRQFDEKILTLIGSLSSYNLQADLFFNVKDFTKTLALVPCSAKTGEGIQELILMLCGLSQRYLQSRLQLGKEAKGIILEVKKEKSLQYYEAVLYDGELASKDTLAIASFQDVILARIRTLEQVIPLKPEFQQKERVTAAAGIRLQFAEKLEILPGMPFVVFKNNLKEVKEEFKKEVSEQVKTEKSGIIIKADSLGSLEALLILLKHESIKVVRAGIGSINKSDILAAKANIEIDELDAVVLGFNISIDEDAKEISGNVKIFTDDVVYKLIESIKDYRIKKAKEIEKRRLMALATICKIKILHQHIFRNSNPAVFGVDIVAGKLRSGLPVIDNHGEKIGRIKNIQSENKSVNEASEGMQVAISIPGVTFDRQLKEVDFLYTDLSERQFKEFKKNKDLLTANELKALQEVADIKARAKGGWVK